MAVTIEQLVLEFRGLDVSLTSVGNSVIASLKAIEEQALQTGLAIKTAMGGGSGGSATFSVDTSGVQAAQQTIAGAAANVTQTWREAYQAIGAMGAAQTEEVLGNYAVQLAAARTAAAETVAAARFAAAETTSNANIAAAQMASANTAAIAENLAGTKAGAAAATAAWKAEADLTAAIVEGQLATVKAAAEGAVAIERAAGAERVAVAQVTAAEMGEAGAAYVQQVRLQAIEALGATQAAGMESVAQAKAFMIEQNAIAQASVTTRIAAAKEAQLALAGAGSGMAQAGSEAEKANSATSPFVRTLVRLVEAIAILGFAKVIGEMISFSAVIETSRIGLAGMVATYNTITDGTGRALSGIAKFNAGMVEADDIMKRLIATEIRTGVSLDVLAKGFQSIYGFGTAIGGTKDQLVSLSAEMANLAVSENIPFETLARQMGLAEGGFIRMNSRLGALFKSLGIDQAVLATWRDQGILVEQLNEKLKFFELMGGAIANSWTGAMTTLRTTLGLTFKEGFEPLFEGIKRQVIAVRQELLTVTPGATPGAAPNITFNPEVMAKAREVAESLAGALVTLMPLLPSLVNLFASLAKAVGDFVTSLAPAIPTIKALIDLTALLIDKFGATGLAVYAGVKAFTALSTVVPSVILTLTEFAGTVVAIGVSDGMLAVAAYFASLPVAIAVATAAVVYLLGKLALLRETGKTDDAEKAATEALIANIERTKQLLALKASATATSPRDKAVADAEWAELDRTEQKLRSLAHTSDDLTEATKRYTAVLKNLGTGVSHDNSVSGPLGDLTNAKIIGLQAQIAGFATTLEGKLAVAALTTKAALHGLDEEYKKLIASGDLVGAAAIEIEKGLTRQVGGLQQKQITGDWVAKQIEAGEKIREETRKLHDELLKEDEQFDAEQARLREQGLAAEERYWQALAAINSTGAETKQQAIENAYVKGMERIRHNTEVAEKALRLEVSTGALTGTMMDPEEIDRRFDAITAAEARGQASVIEVRRAGNAMLAAEQSKDWARYRAEMEKHLQDSKGLSPVEAQLDALHSAAEKSLKTAQTVNDGIVAGWLHAQDEIKSQGRITAEFVIDNWRTMKQGFDDILVGGISHGWEGLLGALKSASDGYLKNFSKMVTEMVTTWLVGQQKMSETTNGGVDSQGNAMGTGISGRIGSGPPAVANQYAAAGLGAAASGFGGATGGAASFGQGVAPYLSAAALVAGATASIPIVNIVGLIVAAVIALVGVIVNLLNKSTEQVYRLTADSLKLSAGGNLSGAGAGGVVAKSMGGQAIVDYRDKLVGSMFDMFNQGAPAQAQMLSKAVNDAISKYILGIDFTVSAGSDEDIKKDFELLFTTVMPREMMAKLFGMRLGGGQAQQFGGQDIGGISGAKYYDSRGGLDTTAPIVAFLTSIGFAMTKVQELADQSQTTDAKVFLQRLQDLVSIVIRAKDVATQLGLSAAGVYGQVTTARDTSPAKAFADQASNLVTMAEQLASFTGQEQIDRGKTLIDTYEKYAAAQKAAITELFDLARAFSDRIDTLFVTMTNKGKNADQLFAEQAARQNALLNPAGGATSHGIGLGSDGSVYGTGVSSANIFAGLTTVAQITKMSEAAFADLSAMWDYLLTMVTRAQAVREKVDALFVTMADKAKSADQLFSEAWSRQLGPAKAPAGGTREQVMAAAETSFTDLSFIWDRLLAMLTQAQGLKTAFAELTTQVSMSVAGIWDATHKNPFRIIAENIADMADSLTWANQLGAKGDMQGQLDVLARIKDQGVSTFQAIADEIGKIHIAQVSMNTDIDAQILSISRSLMGNQGQLDKWNQEIDRLNKELAGTNLSAEQRAFDQQRLTTVQGYTQGYDPHELINDYMRQITEDRANLSTATTPEEVTRLTKRIQDTINLYLAQFQNENQTPEKKQAAADFAKGVLESTRAAANAAYTAFNAVLEAAKTTLLGVLTAAGVNLTNFVGGVQTDIGLVTAALLTLKTNLGIFVTGLDSDIEKVRLAFVKLKDDSVAAFGALASSITDPNSGLVQAINATSGLFTGAGGFNTSLGGATTAVGDFTTAVTRAKGILDTLDEYGPHAGTGGTGAAGQQFALSPQVAAGYGAMRAIDMGRRRPGLFSPSQGVMA